jgi:hypothetical protein
MKKLLLILSLLALPTVARAQERPIAASTLQTTDTTTSSVKVGCAIGSSTCTGGILFGTASGTSISLSGGYLEIQNFVPASQTFRLVNNAGTLQWNGSALAIGGSISGTTNTIPVFTGASSIGNSIMTQSGTTITVANTLSATTVSATTLTGTLSTASQTNVTGVGTITTGTWNATKIGLLYGGTNADLSGTGGTSQFLRQNSLGAAITVVRPAISDLSDGTNVALLNAANTFSGSIQFTANVSYPGGGSISKLSNNGLMIGAVAGSSYDFAIVNPSGASGIMLVPTGTLTVQFGGDVVAGGSTHSQSSATVNPDISLADGSYSSSTLGARVRIGRDTNGSTAPGRLELAEKSGTASTVWTDSTGVLRIATGATQPTESAGDTVGTVVGSQTSTLDTKLLLAPFTDTRHALEVVAGAPLWRFRYRDGQYGASEFVGVMSNTTPEVMMDPSPEHPEGRSFSPVSAFGYTAAAIAELRKELAAARNPFYVDFRSIK